MPDRRKLGAEFIGTFAMVFVGCGAISVELSQPGVIGHVGVSLIFGLVVGAMIYATGHISGAHFNPAVTLAMLFKEGKAHWMRNFTFTITIIIGTIISCIKTTI